MSDILCIYYSRTGHTKQAMEEVAQALGAETVELRDGVNRSGARGWLRCGCLNRQHIRRHTACQRQARYKRKQFLCEFHRFAPSFSLFRWALFPTFQ